MAAIERIAGTLDELANMAKAGNAKPPVEQIARAVYDARGFVRHVRQVEDIPDTLPAGWNRPAPADTDALVALLNDAAERVSIGDSFEGTITWVMPTDEPELDGFD